NAEPLVNHLPGTAFDCYIEVRHSGTARVFQQHDARLVKGRIGIGKEVAHQRIVQLTNREAGDSLPADSPKVAVGSTTAGVTVSQNAQIGLPRPPLQVLRVPADVNVLAPFCHAARPPGMEVSQPETESIGATGTHHEPAAEHYEIR